MHFVKAHFWSAGIVSLALQIEVNVHIVLGTTEKHSCVKHFGCKFSPTVNQAYIYTLQSVNSMIN